MQVREREAERSIPQDSPDWVSDWWMPAGSPAQPDADLAALLAPQPPAVIQVMGRRPDAERAAARR
jgi:hypothetical protein